MCSWARFIVGCLTLACAGASAAWAQCQLASFVAPDGAAGDRFGRAVAVGDRRVLSGAIFDDATGDNSGSAWLFEITGSSVGTRIVPGDSGGLFGRSVALERDLAIVGACAPRAYLFAPTETGWTQFATLEPWDGHLTSQYGWSVALVTDTLVVGAPEDSNENGGGAGSAYVFERDPNGVWLQSAKLLASDGGGGDALGTSVAIHDDLIVAGAPEDDPLGFASGSAYVFERDPNGAWIETAKLLPSDHGFIDQFGGAVAVQDQTVLVGAHRAPDADEPTGAVYIFEPDAQGQWVEIQKLTPPEGENSDYFGVSVALDGDLAVVGAENYGGTFFGYGAAFVYHRQPDRTWRLVGTLMADDPQDGAEFGRSVALSGNLAVVGAPFHDVVDSDGNTQVDAGAAYVFAVGPDRDENGVMDVCECRAAVEGVGAASGDDQSRDNQSRHDQSRDRQGAVSGRQSDAADGFVGNPDLNLDQRVGMGDLLILLTNFGHDRDNPPAGHSPPHAALHEYGDLDLDQDIDLADLALMLAAYDRACE